MDEDLNFSEELGEGKSSIQVKIMSFSSGSANFTLMMSQIELIEVNWVFFFYCQWKCIVSRYFTIIWNVLWRGFWCVYQWTELSNNVWMITVDLKSMTEWIDFLCRLKICLIFEVTLKLKWWEAILTDTFYLSICC